MPPEFVQDAKVRGVIEPLVGRRMIVVELPFWLVRSGSSRLRERPEKPADVQIG
jgi:hypothetical protein